ncbi:hypothetical protein [uncultured Ruminococcus sp.]|uniref:hypothetical protein n=1 Tax=uncultured Ruminococcus sp. TaxID=165186 RepID=UPI0025EE3261|nr:hypothetical protein [uncultured Ruminococcus sp.]
MIIVFFGGGFIIAVVLAIIIGAIGVGELILNALGIITIIMMIAAGALEICECYLFTECYTKNKNKIILPIILNVVRSVPVFILMYYIGHDDGYTDDSLLDIIASIIAYVIIMLVPFLVLLVNHALNALQQYCIDEDHEVIAYIIATIITVAFYIPLPMIID